MATCVSKFRFGVFVIAFCWILPSTLYAQSAQARDLMKEHKERINRLREQSGFPTSGFPSDRFEEMRSDANDRMAEMRERHDKMISDFRNRSQQRSVIRSDTFEQMRREADERMEESRRRHDQIFEEFRSGRSFPSTTLEEMEGESEDRMKRHEALINEMRASGTSSSHRSSSSGENIRIRGRAIRGIVMLVMAIGAGVMRLLGISGSKSSR